jgi:3-oxoacyl-[acyl-carrier-protein] synthase-3
VLELAEMHDRSASHQVPVRSAAIAAVGTALPERVVPNSELAGRLGVSERWIARRTGIEERRYLGEDESLWQLAARAGRVALERAAISPEDVDLVLVGTCTPDRLLPHVSPFVASSLGARRAGAIDLGSACMGFLAGLPAAASWVESGRGDCVLLIGADGFSRYIDPGDPQTVSLFGDGAGAAVVVPSEGGGRIGPVVLRGGSDESEVVSMTVPERRIRMDGPETFRHAIDRLAEVTLEVLEVAGLGLGDVDVFAYHQANRRILQAVGERLDLRAERVVDCVERIGNASSASIPLALGAAWEQGRLGTGTRVLSAGIGAGFVWGGAVLEWGR